MSSLQLTEENRTMNTDEKSTLDCYDKAWVLLLSGSEGSVKNYECFLCQQITKNPMEINCIQHTNEKMVIVGEDCLHQYLRENGQSCPIQKHSNCQYFKNTIIEQQIDNLSVICPRQYQFLVQGKKHNELDFRNEMDESKFICKYKGPIRDIEDHLKTSCTLMPLECRFKLFGCECVLYKHNYDDHMQAQMQNHLEMAMNQIQFLNQKMKDLSNALQEKADQIQLCQVFLELILFDLSLFPETIINKLKEVEELKSRLDDKEIVEKKSKELNLEIESGTNNTTDRNDLQENDKKNANEKMLYSPLENKEMEEDKQFIVLEALERTCQHLSEYFSFLPAFCSLINGKDFLLISENNKTIKLKNKEWNEYRFGIYLIGEKVTLTVDCDKYKDNDFGYLQIKTSHLLIKCNSSCIDCSELGFASDDGIGKGGQAMSNDWRIGGGAGYGTKGKEENNNELCFGKGGKCYGEETLLKQIHYGSGGGSGRDRNGDTLKGGRGGGIIHLIVQKHFVNYGVLKCKGGNGHGGYVCGGGGSGGSVLILLMSDSTQFQHILGTIICTGGNQFESCKNRGGNGRIAIHGMQIPPNDIHMINPRPFSTINSQKTSTV
ncbi:hypothetical protein RFI_23236 [Reticulomyxa filosa]|uniref:TRAF-type domain-containing protein n=1 Tax=Reticulomyxa filosa TaxID=46433 RepID=X6MJE3_RETFI|nr:hypothetical protein RFI_23236 [Reticulomyxa filosa]|eukprot:ETO14133.1 hypothetical protein RFI_23236 [Reticulomyxa filosa]